MNQMIKDFQDSLPEFPSNESHLEDLEGEVIDSNLEDMEVQD